MDFLTYFFLIPPPPPGVDPCSTRTIRLITAPSLEWHFIDYRALSGIYQLFAYLDLMRLRHNRNCRRSIPLSSSSPLPTPERDIASGEWLLGNICSECMGLSHASGVVCSCADQQFAIPPLEERNCWAAVAHPAVLSQPMASLQGPSLSALESRKSVIPFLPAVVLVVGSQLLRNRQRSDLERNALLSPFQTLNSFPDASIGLCRPKRSLAI